MVLEYFKNLKIKNSSAGISLVEIMVVIFVITVFTLIMISDFPKIQRQLALSRASYELAQNLRVAQDLGFSGSGIQTVDHNGAQLPAKGYGVYANLGVSATQYIIYADIPDATGSIDQKYTSDKSYSGSLCSAASSPIITDCVVEIIDLSKESLSLRITGFQHIPIDYNYTSINFVPPRPAVRIDNIDSSHDSNPDSNAGITLGTNSDSTTRTVWINTSGLIEVK